MAAMHRYEVLVLKYLKENGGADIDDLQSSLDIGRDAVLWAVQQLSEKKAVSVKQVEHIGVRLSDEGRADIEAFPEEKVVGAIREHGGRLDAGAIKDQVGLSWAKKNGWITIEGGKATLTVEGAKLAAGGTGYELKEVLRRLEKAEGAHIASAVKPDRKYIDVLVKRGLVEIDTRTVVGSVEITDDGLAMLSMGGLEEEGIGALTKEIIANRSWEVRGFKKYEVNAPVEPHYPARLHPVREFINTVRHKWLEMGFVEVSGPIVEAAFWNFDALFSPQDHPTREMQDTFFLKNPKELTVSDLEVLEHVRKMHVSSWKERWSEEIAKQAVLRTHTTSVSAHYIRTLAGVLNANYPLRLFSVGPVFRNESIDYKHLAELHQYDGIVVGKGLTLANLIDTLRKFYAKLGFDNVKLRPSYFPFTEPSLEAFYYDEEHGDSIELTGGGIIRREITRAMGLDKTVLAWGGGIERLMLSRGVLGLDSILTPYKNNVGWLRTRPNLKV